MLTHLAGKQVKLSNTRKCWRKQDTMSGVNATVSKESEAEINFSFHVTPPGFQTHKNERTKVDYFLFAGPLIICFIIGRSGLKKNHRLEVL